MLRKVGDSLWGQFKFGGCYKLEGYDALLRVVKVGAHERHHQAANEGWEHHWKANNAADEIAKQVRPKLNEKKQKKAVANQRAKRKGVEAPCRRLEGQWQDMFKLKKT